jgi:DNA-binding GntR family transcriptional regulator
MSRPLALQRVSTVDAIAAALRTRIMDGELAAGERLRELELADAYGVARHSLRAALRDLAAEGLVTIEPNRGARVAQLTADDVGPLFELRVALELEAARLALARNGGRLPKPVHDRGAPSSTRTIKSTARSSRQPVRPASSGPTRR